MKQLLIVQDKYAAGLHGLEMHLARYLKSDWGWYYSCDYKNV